MPRKTILYIQHAARMGGAPMSLLYLAGGIDKSRFRPVVALIYPTPELRSLYEAHGIEVVDAPGITTFEHTTALWATIFQPRSLLVLFNSIVGFRRTLRLTRGLVDRVRPDIVHLNSVVLSPSAIALRAAGIPIVWHVREAPVRGVFGLRTRWLRHQLGAIPAEIIFLSDYDHKRWIERRRGIVLPNFVTPLTGASAGSAALDKSSSGVGGPPVILFLGGFLKIKGTHLLVSALHRLKTQGVDFRCILAGPMRPRAGRKWKQSIRDLAARVGYRDYEAGVRAQIDRLGLGREITILPFTTDTPGLFRRASVLAFPSTRPHFARPVMEAACFGVPAVASRIGGVMDLVEDGATGILVEPGDADSLARGLGRMLAEPETAAAFGTAARQKAERDFNASRILETINSLYGRLVPSRPANSGRPGPLPLDAECA
jgi:glycosyltransferase involved in cell wall biosynthesis